MPIILSPSVPAGKTVYAIVSNDSGQVWTGSGFSNFSTQSAAAIPMTESPVGSGRHSAAFPPTGAGIYGIAYFEREGSVPAATDSAYGSESVAVSGGNLNVVLNPTYTTPPDPIYTGGAIQVHRGESGIIGIPVFDGSGQPVTLDPSPVLKVYEDTFPQQTVIFTVVATASGNTASASYTSGNTATSGRYRYDLIATDGDVLVQGAFIILPTA